MKLQVFSLLLLLTIFFTGCNSRSKSDEVASYIYNENSASINPELLNNIGNWIEPNLVCYGLVVSINKDSIPLKGKPVRAKIIQIDRDAIKMKALENVSLGEEENCYEMRISQGQIWLEKDGELFQTKKEAINYLKSNNLYIP